MQEGFLNSRELEPHMKAPRKKQSQESDPAQAVSILLLCLRNKCGTRSYDSMSGTQVLEDQSHGHRAENVSAAPMTRHCPKCFVFIIKSSKQPILYKAYNYDPHFTDKETEAKKFK